jgi:AraC-like DNA-binding protein
MSRALSVCHGIFGRASLYELDRPLVRHAHRDAHLLFFLGGSPGEVAVGDRRFQTNQSTAIAINPWDEHGFSPLRRMGAGLFLIFYLSPEWLKASRAVSVSRTPFFVSPVVPLTSAMQELRDEICQMLVDGVSSRTALELRLSRLMQAFDTNGAQMDLCGESHCQGNWSSIDFRLKKSITALSSVRTAAVNLADIARGSGLSRAHFFKLFREQLGLTPVVYANVLRIETAIDQIARKRASITMISNELGFSCQSAFTRFFAAHVGMPPTDYQRAVQVMEIRADA